MWATPLYQLGPGRIGQGERKCEHGALTGRTLKLERAPVRFDNTFADVEAQARGGAPAILPDVVSPAPSVIEAWFAFVRKRAPALPRKVLKRVKSAAWRSGAMPGP